jgi:hypothetical protein
MNDPELTLIPALPSGAGAGLGIRPACHEGHRNHAVRETRMETRRVGNRGASRASHGLGAPLFPLFFHPACGWQHQARSCL